MLFTGCTSGGNSPPPQQVQPSPASFFISNLRIEPSSVAAGQTTSVSVVVVNSGGTQGSYNAVLNIGGAQDQNQAVSVSPGGTQTISFNVSRAKCGEHVITVGSLSGSFTVTPAQVDKIVPETKLVVLETGTRFQLKATAFDLYDNMIPGIVLSYKVNIKAGQVDASGLLTTGRQPRSLL